MDINTELDTANRQLNHCDHVISNIKWPVCLLANDLNDPLNIGSLFRLADTFAIESIYLTGSSPVPPHAKIRKTSRHTDNTVKFSHTAQAIEVIQSLKSRHYKIISLELTTQSIEVQQLELSPADLICLIVGAEKNGVNQLLLDASDVTIHIPMSGKNSSMNVVCATAIALYEITSQLKQA